MTAGEERVDRRRIARIHVEVVVPEAADSIQAIAKSKHYLLVAYSNGYTLL